MIRKSLETLGWVITGFWVLVMLPELWMGFVEPEALGADPIPWWAKLVQYGIGYQLVVVVSMALASVAFAGASIGRGDSDGKDDSALMGLSLHLTVLLTWCATLFLPRH